MVGEIERPMQEFGQQTDFGRAFTRASTGMTALESARNSGASDEHRCRPVRIMLTSTAALSVRLEVVDDAVRSAQR